MKKLNVMQMENLQGGLLPAPSGRQCMIAGILCGIACAGGLWGPALILAGAANLAGC